MVKLTFTAHIHAWGEQENNKKGTVVSCFDRRLCPEGSEKKRGITLTFPRHVIADRKRQ